MLEELLSVVGDDDDERALGQPQALERGEHEPDLVIGPGEFAGVLRAEPRLEGLPHGSYAWSVTAPDGRTVEGTLVVLPSQPMRVPIVLPH